MTAYPKVRISHMGIWVHDLEMMADFYTRLYGFHVSDTGHVRGADYVFLTHDPGVHHQLVMATGRPEEVSFNVLNQISFQARSLADVRTFHAALQDEPVSDIRGITHGNAWSVYFHDPEGNRSEIFCDTPWYVSQPFGNPIDLSLPEDEIVRITEEMIRENETLTTVEEWRRETERRMKEAEPA